MRSPAIVRLVKATAKRANETNRGSSDYLTNARFNIRSVESVRLAVRSGRLDPQDAEDVLTLLQRMVTTPIQPRGGDRPPVPPSVEVG